jgi:GNAT superfamily N-acetyltransferase
MPLDFTAYYDGEVKEQREQSQACLNSAESRENSTEGQAFIGFTIVYPRNSFNRRTKQGQSGTCSSYALQGGGRPKVNWFWYFAVSRELRGKGYGQQILTQLIERYKGQPFVLDMESTTQVCDNLEERRKRQSFYMRNGFRDTNVYRTYNDITMTIMMRGEGTFTMQDWDDIVDELKKYWWPKDINEEYE